VVAPAGEPRRRTPPAIAWIVLLAVLVGVAAALVSRPVATLGPTSPSLGPLSWDEVRDIAVILLVAGLGYWIYTLLTGPRVPVPSRAVATALVILLLGVLFVEVAGLVHVAPVQAPTNTTGKNPPGNGTTPPPAGNNTTLFPGIPGVTIPAWAGYSAVVIIAILAGVLLVPFLVARARRSHDEGEAPVRGARRALEEALDRLDRADEADARAAILALYARLLLALGPRLGMLDSRTPGEIQRDAIESLGVRPRVAQDLTETFEEARYSSHPMSQAAVQKAREALTDAILDLADRGRPTR
jgi:hypothetical protein